MSSGPPLPVTEGSNGDAGRTGAEVTSASDVSEQHVWSAWVVATFGVDAEVAEAAGVAAAQHLSRGGSRVGAELVACTAVGRRPSVACFTNVRQERRHLEDLREALRAVASSRGQPDTEVLDAELRGRIELLDSALAASALPLPTVPAPAPPSVATASVAYPAGSGGSSPLPPPTGPPLFLPPGAPLLPPQGMAFPPPPGFAGGLGSPLPYPPGGLPAAPVVRKPAQVEGAVVLGALGVFLLGAATILFEASTASYGGVERLLIVVALQLVLVIAALGCARSPRLAPATPIYTAAAAVVFPLLLLATAVFLHLGDHGLSVPGGLALGGLLCGAAYGWIAIALRERLYGGLALVAGSVGWISGLVALHLGWLSPLGVLPAVALFAYFDVYCARSRVVPSTTAVSASGTAPVVVQSVGQAVFGLWLAPGLVVSTAASLIWTVVVLAAQNCGGSVPLQQSCALHGGVSAAWLGVIVPASLAAIFAAGAFSRTRRAWGLVAIGFTGVASLALNWAVSGGWSGLAVLSIALAWVLVGLSYFTDKRKLFEGAVASTAGLARSWQVLAGVLAAVPLLWVHSGVWWVPVLAACAAGVFFMLVVQSGQSGWRYAFVLESCAGVIFALWAIAYRLGWVPSSATLTSGELVALLGPLFVLGGLGGLGAARRATSAPWAIPLYVVTGLLGGAVTIAGVRLVGDQPTHQHYALLGVLFVMDWLVLELVARSERWYWLVPGSSVALVAGAVAFVRGWGGVGAVGTSVVMIVIAAVILLVGSVRNGGAPRGNEVGSWSSSHAWSALVLWALGALWSLGAMGSLGSLSPGLLVAIGALASLAGLLTLAHHEWGGSSPLATFSTPKGPVSQLPAPPPGAVPLPGPARAIPLPPGWWLALAAVWVVSLESMPVSWALHITTPLAYVALPSAVAAWIGIELPDRYAGTAAVMAGRLLSAAGLGMLLFTTWIDATLPGYGRIYLVVLLLIGIWSVSVGLRRRRQIPVIFGTLGIGAGGLLVLAQLARYASLYVVVALLAIGLLVASTALFGQRRGSRIPTDWSTWK